MMNGTERVLLIILSATLAIFLLLAIAAAVLVIKILKQIRVIVEKAENIADKAETLSSFFQKSAGPVAIGRFITNMAEAIFQKRGKRNSSKGEDDA